MGTQLRALARDSRGLAALEYGLLGAIIALVLVAALPPLAARLQPLFATMAAGLAV